MLDQGGFSGAGVSDNAQKLPLVDVKAHVIHGAALKGRSRAVGMCQVFHLNDRFQ